MSDNPDDKDVALVWPDGTFHRVDEAEPDATEQAIAANGNDFIRLFFPIEFSDDMLAGQIADDMANGIYH